MAIQPGPPGPGLPRSRHFAGPYWRKLRPGGDGGVRSGPSAMGPARHAGDEVVQAREQGPQDEATEADSKSGLPMFGERFPS